MAKAKTPAAISPSSALDITAALKKIGSKLRLTAKYQKYFNGKPSLALASEKFRTKFGNQLKEFSDNLCRTCVVAPCDRLEVVGFSDETDKAVFDAAWKLWKYSSMPRFAKRIHKDAFKYGDAYIVVWADGAGAARIFPVDARQCCVWYNSETNRVERGARLWRDTLDKRFYLTLYYSDRIEKYVSKATYESSSGCPAKADAFLPREVEGEQPGDLVNESGICPMFHFGIENSILDDVMPLNDALNKEICDLLIASESNSQIQRWTTGISYATDEETGKKIIPFDFGDTYITTEKEQARFGEFAEKTLTGFLDVINDFRMEIARVTGIPAYYFMLEKGQFPSGEALRKAESRFTSLITDAQRDFGETWSTAVAFGLWLDNKTPNFSVEKAAGNQIQTAWSPASPMSETEKVDLAARKKSIGVSDKRLQSEVGYTDADIEQIEADNGAATDSAARSFGKVFDAGNQIIK